MLGPATAAKRPCPDSDEGKEYPERLQKSSTRAAIKGQSFQVKGPDAQHLTLALNPRQTIQELKVEISKEINIPVEIQSLRFGSQLLKDERSIGSYLIKDSSTIECFAVQRGGSKSEEVEEQSTIGGRKYRKYVQSLADMSRTLEVTVNKATMRTDIGREVSGRSLIMDIPVSKNQQFDSPKPPTTLVGFDTTTTHWTAYKYDNPEARLTDTTKTENTATKIDASHPQCTILFLFILLMCAAGFRSPRATQYSEIRLFTLVELSLSCTCANTTDSASFLPPVPGPLEKSHLDSEIEEGFDKLTGQNWRGDNMESPPPSDMLRIATFNANGQVLVDHKHVVDSLWNKLQDLKVSAVAIQDTRLSTPDLQTSAQKQASMFIDGERSTCSWSNAPHLGNAVGVGVMMKGDMVSRVVKCKQAHLIQDQRGWNRYTGMALQGRNGIKLAIISIYVPCAYSTSWKAQQELLINKQDSRDPREVALRDVFDEMDSLGENVRFILAGDFNIPWNEQGRTGQMDSKEKKLSKLLNSLCEVRSLTSAWNAMHPNTKAWTRQTSTFAHAGSSHIDHIIVSECLIRSKSITRIGILQDEQIGKSDHRLVVMEWDPCIALNLAEAPNVNQRPKQIDFSNKLQVKKFCKKVMEIIPKERMKQELEGLEQMSNARQTCQVNLSVRIIAWFEHLSILPNVERDIMDSKSCKSQGRKLHCWTPQLVVLRKWHRRCQLLLRAIRQGCWNRVRTLTNKMINSRKLVEEGTYDPDVELDISSCFGGIQPLNTPPGGDSEVEWAEWVHELKEIIAQLYGKLHGRYRKNQRLKTWEWAQKRDESYKSGKCKQQLRRDLGDQARSGLLSRVEIAQEVHVRQDGSEETRPARTVEEPKQVKEALVENFSKWFGKGRCKWFIGKQIWLKHEGAELRKKIAAGALDELEVLGTDEECIQSLKIIPTLSEMEKDGILEIPIRCWKVIKAARCKLVGGVEVSSLTKDTLTQHEAHTSVQWKAIWSRKKAGTTPGRSCISTTMMKIMQQRLRNEDGEVGDSPLLWLSDLIRRWTNLALKHGAFPDLWRASNLIPIPKIQDSIKIHEQRPLCMMEVIRNAAVGGLFRRLGARWQDIGAIHGSQYAFQSGKATEGPLKIFTGVTQDAYLKRGPLHSLTHDISRAYDNVEHTIGKEMSMRRLGVPEWLIDIVFSLDNEAQVSILTAHGLSVPFHPETGWPQGSEEGPIGWLTHYDWLLQLHDEAVDRYPYLVNNMFQGESHQHQSSEKNKDVKKWGLDCQYKHISVVGPVYADDARWMARNRQGILKAANISEDFLGFHGGINNIPKSGLLSGLWEGNTDDPNAMGFKADMTPMTIERVERNAVGDPQLETFHSKTGYESTKYLGLQATDTVTYGETEDKVAEQIRHLSCKAKSARNKAAGTAMIVRNVAMPKANYQLKYISSSQDRLDSIWKPLEQMWTSGIGLPRTVNRHLQQSINGSLSDSTWIEKLVMLVLLLNRPDLAGDITRNETYNLQNLYGGLTPVLETRYIDAEMGWAGDWIGRLWQWMSANDLFIHGGNKLDPACRGDCALTDIVIGTKNRAIRLGSMCYDLTNLSQLILPDGITFRSEVQTKGKWNYNGNPEWEGLNWSEDIRQTLGGGYDNRKLKQCHALKGKRSGNVWFQLGKEVGFREANKRNVSVGRIIGQCKGWLAIEAWTDLRNETRSTRHNNGMSTWMKPVEAQRITIKDTLAFPISTTLIHTDPEETYRVEDSTEWMEEWWKYIGAEAGDETDSEDSEGPTSDPNLGEEDTHDTPWKLDKGQGLAAMVPAEVNKDTETLWTMSDGGVSDAGTERARAGYGFIIRDTKEFAGWGNFNFTLSGRGPVEGTNLYMDSTRAEARGLLATMISILSSSTMFPSLKHIDHATDNEAVVEIYEGLKERSAADWIRATDTDIWHEIQQAELRFQEKNIRYTVRWVRSHPERRHTWTKDWNEDDTLNYMADRLATIAIQEYVGPGNTQLKQLPGSKRIWYVYTQAQGGTKLRLTGKLRKMLNDHVRFRHHYKYLETSQASHITGQNLHSQIDQSLLRKIWKPPVTCSRLTHLVRWAKVLANMLATETVLTRRNQGTCSTTNGMDMALCKLCGIAEETNFHMLCECTGDIDLVGERTKWIRQMRAVITKTLTKHMSKEQLKVLLDLWSLTDLGKLSEWIDDDRLNLEAPGNDTVLLHLKVLIAKQKGVDNHMFGITSTGWRDFLEDSIGLSPEAALQFQAALHKHTQHAIDQMWKARNSAKFARTNPKQTWERRAFEDAIRCWKSDAERKGREIVVGTEARIRAWSRNKKLIWVHNRLTNQQGITEFWNTAPVPIVGAAVVGSGLGLEPGLHVEIEPGRVGQIPSDLPNKGQIRVEREKERKQSHLERYFQVNPSSDNKLHDSDVVSASAIGPSPKNQEITQVRHASTHSKKRKASGDLIQKASKTQILPLEVSEADRLIMEDQAQIVEEDQVGDRTRAAAALSQPTSISDISEKDRVMIARKREAAIKRLTQKKPREEAGQVACEKHKKQKSKQREIVPARGKREKRNFVGEEAEQADTSKRKKLNGRKRNIVEVAEAEQADLSKRQKSDGQDGCKQLGCSTHKGIS